MSKSYFLTPGPSELYFTVPDHLQSALKENIASISHRSKDFENVFSSAVNNIRELLNVPTDFHIVFTNSANEIWERLLQNCVEKNSFHFVNGSFSKKFYSFAEELGKSPIKHEVPFGEGFDISTTEIPSNTELIGITQNETSSGVCFPVEDIYQIRKKHPEALLAIDAVSAIPYIDIDFTQIDSLYFSVQKGMGLPAGLGVWIFNDRCVAKSKQLADKGISLGTYHTIPSLLKQASKNQTPATPNVLGIYLLAKVCEDMLRRSLEVIRQETNFKAALIYNLLEENANFEPLVKEKKHRSQTVLVAEVKNEVPSDLITRLKKEGIIIGGGYGQHKATQIRIANFPTHSKETFFRLADLLN